MKFLHTADWQLGMTFRFPDERVSALCEARLETVRALLALAQTEGVEFVLATGDQFQSNRVETALVNQTVALLAEAAPLPIYLIAGNHDPLDNESVYALREALAAPPENVHILRDNTPIPVEGGTLYPCPCRARLSSDDPTAWIPPRADTDGIRVGIAHGSWLVLPDLPRDDHPIPADAATARALDYLALGHWHSTFARSDRRTFYSGAHEPTAFNEPNSGNVLLVTIEAPGALPVVEQRRVARYWWREEAAPISDRDSVDALEARLANVTEPARTLLRLTLRGVADLDGFTALDPLREAMAANFFVLDVDASGVMLAPSAEELAAFAPSGYLAAAVQALRAYATGERSDPPPNWHCKEPPTPEAAQRALALLYRLVSGR